MDWLISWKHSSSRSMQSYEADRFGSEAWRDDSTALPRSREQSADEEKEDFGSVAQDVGDHSNKCTSLSGYRWCYGQSQDAWLDRSRHCQSSGTGSPPPVHRRRNATAVVAFIKRSRTLSFFLYILRGHMNWCTFFLKTLRCLFCFHAHQSISSFASCCIFTAYTESKPCQERRTERGNIRAKDSKFRKTFSTRFFESKFAEEHLAVLDGAIAIQYLAVCLCDVSLYAHLFFCLILQYMWVTYKQLGVVFILYLSNTSIRILIRRQTKHMIG